MADYFTAYVGFGILVGQDEFNEKFPGTFTDAGPNDTLIDSLETDLVNIIWGPENENVFIVARGYLTNAGDWAFKIPCEQFIQTGQPLVPWFQANFPQSEPGIYMYTDYREP